MRIEIAKPERMSQSGSSLLRLIQNNDMPVLDLLVRESVQNSLDASKEDVRYVDVEYLTGVFESSKLSRELDGISEALQNKYPEHYYEYIAVRDSNTVGLTGETNYKNVKNNKYGNLLKLIYEISKPQENEGAGGSWGLGKTVYFRIGIGMVIYYSRIINKYGQYESRLAASFVEDENRSDAIIPAYRGYSKRGIAWWGDLIEENRTQPVTDESYIDSFLGVFGISPYLGEQTGTTIIIPYIDKEKLLTNNQVEYLDSKEEPIIPYWCKSLEDYLSIAVQRWYAPRLNNQYYPYGAYLRIRINGNGLALDQMEPVFRVIQGLYNRANYKSSDDIFSENNAVVKVEKVNLRKYLEDTTSGSVAFAKVSRELLRMVAPDNKPEPYMYFNHEIRNADLNPAVVCYTRKPGMIISYEDDGPWTSSILPTGKEDYIIAFFVVSSYNKLKNSPTPGYLEEYVRKSEMADHTSWRDWSDDKYNPRLISKMQSGINKIISREFSTEEAKADPKEDSGLSKYLGEMLLPPEGFGNKASAGNKSKKEKKTPVARKGASFKILDNSIKYLNGSMIIPLELSTSAKKKVSKAGFGFDIESESGRLSVDEWENKLGLAAPFQIEEGHISISLIDGKRISENGDIGTKDDEAVVSDIRFIKTRSAGGTCIGMNLYMEEPHSIHLKINVRIGIVRKDVKPVLCVYKEEDLNG